MGIPAIDPAEVGMTGLLWLLFTYGYVLFYASKLISEGSDLLLLVPSLSGLVGGVVLPLLGAVPDGAIMFFSGLGDVETAQETLSVGVGALAGSTIMLLTVPLGLSVYYGRVDFTGTEMIPNYKGNPKLSSDKPFASLSNTGVGLASEIRHGAKMMMLTTIPYFLIQIPALFLSGDRQTISAGEKYWALTGLFICIVFFVLYLYSQLQMSDEGAKKLRRMAVTKEAMKRGAVSLSGALAGELVKIETTQSKIKMDENGSLLHPGSIKSIDGIILSHEVSVYLKNILGDTFHSYDVSGDHHLTKNEFSLFLTDFHESISPEEVGKVFKQFDSDESGTIDYDEFIAACYTIIKQVQERRINPYQSNKRQAKIPTAVSESILSDDAECDDEEHEDLPEEFARLSPDEQQLAIKRRAFTMLAIGTALVLLFSDPMVEVLSETAARLNIPAFYVSFIFAPLASNSSEVIASQYYAKKKTSKTLAVSLTALEGAASMNNTFCLSIFMALIYFRGLAWKYSAETISIVLVQYIIGTLLLKEKMSAFVSVIVLGIFPLSVMFIAFLEYMGMD